MATSEQVMNVLDLLEAAYPAFKQTGLSEATVAVYHRFLREFDAETLMRAAEEHIANGEWFPTIAHLRGTALKLEHGELPLPEEAWHMLREAWRNYWTDESIAHLPEIVKKALYDLGGVVQIGNMTETEQEFLHSRYVKHYAAVAERESRRARMLPETRTYLEMQEQLRLGSGDDE